ncbi:AraC family transcriptional regulator [Actinoallomurus purpureus]|uniref:AraC family transcriptional regulator n=1 Tax=Actinoallomurus purpureus TaxID=478114 RepID=UPI0020921796|nr:AraC family transcriptional regulator [Actinoallomurus purpureus]MCO6008678.1 AraC family transcriptional regulator [Actinoallomurus purpureus]
MTSSGERAAYWRVPGLALEAMHARFEHYVYPMHAHDTYSCGVTDDGAQSFVCRGERHVSGAGLVMAFNPDEPHDGQSAVHHGYRYRMLHLGEDLLRDVLDDAARGSAGLPLFDTPVVDNPALALAVARLHTAVVENAPRLVTEERLTATVLALTRHAATRSARLPDRQGRMDLAAMERARGLLRQRFAENIAADELARAAGCSRFALYRGFRAAYGFAPSDYQRDLRLRRARVLLAEGIAPSTAAAEAGFADQAHLTRWFTRTYGVTPAAYRRGL